MIGNTTKHSQQGKNQDRSAVSNALLLTLFQVRFNQLAKILIRPFFSWL